MHWVQALLSLGMEHLSDAAHSVHPEYPPWSAQQKMILSITN